MTALENKLILWSVSPENIFVRRWAAEAEASKQPAVAVAARRGRGLARRNERGAPHASWISNWLILVAARGNFLRGAHKLKTKNTYESYKGYFLTFIWELSSIYTTNVDGFET